jgi:inhibitor of cysteine peptidase
MRPRLMTGLVLAAAVIAACGKPPANEIALTSAENGKTVEAHPGDTLILRLESNPTTGYEWSVTEEPDTAVVKSAGHSFEGPDPQVPGAGGMDEWRFQAVAPGTTALALAYGRPFEKDTPPAQTFSVTFDVTAA